MKISFARSGWMKEEWSGGAYGKIIVFGIFQRNGKVYTEIVHDCSKSTLQPINRKKVKLKMVIYSDG